MQVLPGAGDVPASWSTVRLSVHLALLHLTADRHCPVGTRPGLQDLFSALSLPPTRRNAQVSLKDLLLQQQGQM